MKMHGLLCGFETKEGREVFDLLLSVNGIGPTACDEHFIDAYPLTQFAGQCLMSRLRYSVGSRELAIRPLKKSCSICRTGLPSTEGLEPLSRISEVDTEVLAALTSLGYSLVEAQAALQYIPRDTPQDVETRLRIALQYFSTP